MPNGGMPMPAAAKPMPGKKPNRFFGVMPIAIMAFCLVAFLLLIFIAVT